jgi:serine/threonine protein kinase
MPEDNGATVAAGQPPRGGSMKFSYASGSKPLEGYTIKRGVGIGGFGEVYFAVTDAGKEVALKRVQRNLDVEIRGVSQCLNLKHTNLVDLYDIRYDDQGNAWVVMEFITGESLKDVIDRNPNGLPREDVTHWFLGVAEGVGYLHDHGIVHRDLKPGNIFSDQGEIKIGDYGLSKFIAASRRSGQTESVGTFHYMAPEIGKGSYGKEIDIYALGIILYEMLTGKVPFDGESSQEIIMRHLTEDPDVSKLSEPFRHVVARAMSKDPELRYTHVSQMVEELGSALRPGSKTVVTATVVPPAAVDKVLYIGDEPPPREMVFGPLRQRKPSIPQVALHPVRRPLPPPTPRQPVSQAVAQSAERAASWWQGSILNTGLKVSVVVVLIAVAIMNPWALIPLAIAAVLIYTVYGGIWLIGRSMKSQAQNSSGIRMRSWQEMVRENLRAKPVGTRIGELTGGYFAAAILSGLISVALVAGVDQFNPNMATLSLYSWLAISSTLGSWAVLTVGKFCEGVESDAWRRRAVLLALGLGLGAAAWGLSDQVLLVDLQNAAHTWHEVDTAFPAAVNSNLLTRFLVFFAAVFAIPGWWKQTDPLRKSRVNLFTLGWCVLWSGIVSLLWPFPQPWGLMLAATVSLSTQLAAPWMTSKERDAAKKEFRRA